MSTPNALKILSTVPYFSEIPASYLNTIAQAATQRIYDRDQVIFIEGETSAGLYVVEKGWLKIIKMSTDGREQVIHFIGPGEAFNALSVFTEIPSPATAVALEASTIWLIRNEIMLELLDNHPKLARSVIQTLAGRVMHLVGLVEDLSLRSVEARLARLLLEQSTEGTVHRQRWATQNELAARLGTVPDVLSRALRKLVEQDLIQVSRHQIQILNPAGLETKARVE